HSSYDSCPLTRGGTDLDSGGMSGRTHGASVRRRARSGAVVVVACASLTWMAVENPPGERFAARARGDSLVATTLTTAQRLRTIADVAGHPVYWVADRPGATLQLTRSHTGAVLIRYLSPGMRPSDRTSPALGVSTVPFLGALAHVRSLAGSAGAQLYRLRDGG